MILERTLINSEIYLLPDEICQNYKDILLEKVKKKFEGHAFDNHGIIYKVHKINNILKNSISEVGTFILFLLEIEIERYLPQHDNELELKIKKICSYGIFFLEDKIRILIPSSCVNSYSLEREENYFYLKKDEKIIKENDTITLKLTEIRFEKDGFSCLGTL